MKSLRNLALAAVIAASPTAAFAATSGTVEAQMTVPYSCDITFPGIATLTPSGSSATASAGITLAQNGDTTYSLTALTVTGTNATGGSITLTDGGATQVVTNTSTSASADGQKLGNVTDASATVGFVLNTSDANFAAGTYSISSTLSCAEFAP